MRKQHGNELDKKTTSSRNVVDDKSKVTYRWQVSFQSLPREEDNTKENEDERNLKVNISLN